eukprot:g207.t1
MTSMLSLNSSSTAKDVVVVDAATVVPVRIKPSCVDSNNKSTFLNYKKYNLTKEAAAQLGNFNWEFKSNLQVLLGQSEVVNWVRSKNIDNLTLMRYGGEWKLPGGSRDADETIEETARRELAEEFDIVVPKDAILRPFRVNSTRVIQGKSYRMYNFVLIEDENPWLSEINIEDLNKRLYNKRTLFKQKYMKNNRFWSMPKHEREKVSPEVYQVAWMDLSDIIDIYLNSKHAIGSYVPVNSYQAEQFKKYNIERRDPMYATMTTIRALEDAGNFEQIRKISSTDFSTVASQLAKQEAETQQWDSHNNTRMSIRLDQKL